MGRYMKRTNITELKEIILFAKEQGIKVLRVGDVAMQFGDTAPSGVVPFISDQKQPLSPTEEDFLYMSSGYDPKEQYEEDRLHDNGTGESAAD